MQWPFEEAHRLLERYKDQPPAKGYVLFETGYGPSGLPHLGTFGEVTRTSMVRFAFSQISKIPSRLFAFSDDMDGLRKIPGNVPRQEMLQKHLGKCLTSIPDPFEKFESFGHHNNAMLCRFLDNFGFSYEFQSSTDWYKSGRFNPFLQLVLENYHTIMEIMLKSLRAERQATYSPFLPVCPRTGVVLQVRMEEIDPAEGSVVYKDPMTHELVKVPVTDGHCKLQWKVDFGMRWKALEVDYEMSGKDLIDTVRLSTKICTALGGRPPETLIYEHFLDEVGQKISKSKGNGMTIDEWLTYAPKESLAYFIYQAPKRAKRLYFDVIPRAVDEYVKHMATYSKQTFEDKKENPLYFLHEGDVPGSEGGLTFSLLLNLATVCNARDDEALWGFVRKYDPSLSPKTHPFLSKLISHARRYASDFVKKHYKIPSEDEVKALQDLRSAFLLLQSPTEEDLQACAFEVGKRHYTQLKDWFGLFYQVLLGQTEGPRLGSFTLLFGVQKMCDLIQEKTG